MDETTPLVSKSTKPHWLHIKPSPWVLFAPLFVLGCTISMLQGPLVQFVIDVICNRIDSTEAIKRPREQCNADSAVQAQVSNLMMWVTVIGSVIGLLSTAIYSKMSDKRGRRPVFIINGLGSLLIVKPRTVVFGRLLASFLSGSMVGQTLSGWVMDLTQSLEPIAITAFASMILWVLFVIFVIPESNKKVLEPAIEEEEQNSRQSIWSKINFISSLSIIFTAKPELTNRASLPILAFIQVLCKCVSIGVVTTVVLYVSYVFAWTPTDVGFFLSFESGASLVGLLVVLPALKKLHEVVVPEGVHDISTRHSSIVLDLWICRLGILFLGLSMTVFTLAYAGWMMYLGAVFQIGAALYAASTKSLMVQIAGEDNAGLVLGAGAILESMTLIFSPILANFLYSHFVATAPWVVYMTFGIIIGVAGLSSLLIRVRSLHSISLDS
ncbi:major facilitator superfamily domain-containing protein [Umbelopsis sp. AD052]|nr:major facilitator superfamily domain-containing protein [Umbelopsis sp. AD052]